MRGENDALAVIWSSKAQNGYHEIIENILARFTLKQAENLRASINTLIENIAKHNHICPISKKKNIHKCVVHKNTSLYYSIKKNTLYIVKVVDNRRNNKY